MRTQILTNVYTNIYKYIYIHKHKNTAVEGMLNGNTIVLPGWLTMVTYHLFTIIPRNILYIIISLFWMNINELKRAF